MAATGVDMVGSVLATTDPHKLFGATKEHGKLIYARLQRSVHPDRNNDPRASEAFDKLLKLWDAMDKPAKSTTITSRKHVYELGGLVYKTDIANVYSVSWDAGNYAGWLKMIRHPANGDLGMAEVKALKKLRDVPDDFKMYHMELEDSFKHRDKSTSKDRVVTVTNMLSGFYTLQQVKDAYPDGIDGRDVSWMMRRLLVAVGTAHDVGLVHGAVTPLSVMIHPSMHGLVLTDWTKSVEMGQKLVATDAEYYAWIAGRKQLTEKTSHMLDIRMAAKTVGRLTQSSDTQLRAFLRGCTISTVPTAAELLVEFDELLERLYGKRTFHPFAMP